MIGYSAFNFNKKHKPVIVTELAKNGGLDSILKLENQSFASSDWNDTKKLINIYGIALAMKYLHEKNIIHFDLKAENILVDENFYPKLSDFGLSKDLKNDKENNEAMKSIVIRGTPTHAAPEMWHSSELTKAVDVYSFAITMFEILTAEKPFQSATIYDILRDVAFGGKRPTFKHPIPKSYMKLMNECWDQQPEKRPTFEQIVESLKKDNGFIKDANVNEDEFYEFIENFDNPDFLKNKNESSVNKTPLSKVIENTKVADKNKIVEEEKIIESSSLINQGRPILPPLHQNLPNQINPPSSPYQQNPPNLPYQQNISNPSYSQNISNLPYQQNISNPSYSQNISNLPYQQNSPNSYNQQNPPNSYNQQNPPNLPYQQNPPNLPYQQNPPNSYYQQNISNPSYSQNISNLPYQQNSPNSYNQQNPPNSPYQQNPPNSPYQQNPPNSPYQQNSYYQQNQQYPVNPPLQPNQSYVQSQHNPPYQQSPYYPQNQQSPVNSSYQQSQNYPSYPQTQIYQPHPPNQQNTANYPYQHNPPSYPKYQ